MANATIALKQESYQGNMLTLLKEGKGGKLVQYAESDRAVIGETHKFYRMDASTTSTDINYFSSLVGTAGDTNEISVTPGFVYSHGFKKENELLITNIDIKSSYMKSFKRAIDRAEDAAIIAAIVAQDGGLTTAGDVLKGISDVDNYNALVKVVAYSQALVKDNDDHGTNVAIAINKNDYASLHIVDKFANADYKGLNGFDGIAGAEFVVTDAVPQGTTYVIPRGIVCFASWKSGDKAIMEYSKETDGYIIWARKSIGATLGAVDADSIIKFSTLVG